ncbi:MAG TPA: NAD(P)H-binding protein [Actinoplanes sp.]|nr:NAD(P)H-binding protein [Actinoplanes sp.]
MTTLVLGATGTTGSLVASRLRADGHVVRTASRRPGAADAVFDWYTPSGFAAALDGVHGVYLVLPDGAIDPEPVVRPFLEQARDTGVQRITLLSSSAIPVGSPGPGEVAARLPDYVPGWAVLRPSWFASNFTGRHAHAQSVRESGEIVSATGDGRTPFIAPADIAAVAAHTLTASAPINRALLLTGPQPLSFPEVADQLSIVTGRTIRHRRVSGAELAVLWEKNGVPRPFAELLASLDEAIAAGAEDRVSPVVEELTGRRPLAFADFLAGQNASS